MNILERKMVQAAIAMNQSTGDQWAEKVKIAPTRERQELCIRLRNAYREIVQCLKRYLEISS